MASVCDQPRSIPPRAKKKTLWLPAWVEIGFYKLVGNVHFLAPLTAYVSKIRVTSSGWSMRGLYSLGPHRNQLEALKTRTRFSKVPIINVLAKSPFLVMWSVSITESSLTQVVSSKWIIIYDLRHGESDIRELNQWRRHLQREWQNRNKFILCTCITLFLKIS